MTGWKTATKREPCAICGKDNCKVSADGAVAMCLRQSEGAFKSSKGWHFHRLRDADGWNNSRRADGSDGRVSTTGNGQAHKPTGNGDGKTYGTVAEAIMAAGAGSPAHLATYPGGDFIIARWNPDGGDKIIRPFRRKKGKWKSADPDGPLPLYHGDDLPPGVVYVLEGEPKTDQARACGLSAVTSAHGANSAANSNWQPLAGRDVVILPDNDDPGRQYARDVAAILLKLNPPARAKIVELPGLAAGEDFVQFDESIGGEPADTRAAIEKLAAATAWLDPTDVIGGPKLRNAAGIEVREVSWLWPGRIPAGRITLLVGAPGLGKSFVTLDVAARVSRGTDWPDGARCPAGDAIVISAEDDANDTIVPRLIGAGADLSRVDLLDSVHRIADDGKGFDTGFCLADVAALRQALQQRPACKLVVVDPIGSFIGAKVDAHRDNEIRAILAPVAELAQRFGAAILIVAHRRKSFSASADATALGSTGFVGIARATWHITHDPQDRERRLFLAGKSNLAKESTGLAFTITGSPPHVEWEPNPVDMSADDAMSDESNAAKPGPAPAAHNAAVAWLRTVLANGPVASGELKNPAPDSVRGLAAAADVSWRTVRRAADSLGVIREKSRWNGLWEWRLPRAGNQLVQDVGQHAPKRDNLANLANMNNEP